MRDLRFDLTNLWRAAARITSPEGGRALMFVSARSGEGTSSIATSFALMAASRSSRSTWLIDLDFRRNPLFKAFDEGFSKNVGRPGRAYDASLNVTPIYALSPPGPDRAEGSKLLTVHQIEGTRLLVTRFRNERLRQGQRVQLKTQLLGRPEKEAGGEFAMPGYGAYETSDGRWIYLLVMSDAHWRKLTASLDMPESDNEEMATLRQRKKLRDDVEAAVRAGVGKFTYDEAAARLRDAGLGFNEVLPLERVLDAPQAHQPGKLREFDFRGLQFEVPEFPGQQQVRPNLPPPEIGEHTVELLAELGYDEQQRDALIAQGAVKQGGPEDFAWAPVRQKG